MKKTNFEDKNYILKKCNFKKKKKKSEKYSVLAEYIWYL